jgi:hypothetical protein
LNLQEDISGTSSQIDLSESADVLQNLTHESAPQFQNILPYPVPTNYHISIIFLPSFNLNSVVPVNLQIVQAQKREIPQRIERKGNVISCPGSGQELL